MSDDVIDGAARAGRLLPVFRGVYAVGHLRIGARGRMFAATLACGDSAVVSHRSAAHLLGLLDRAPVVIDVIAPGERGRGIDGLRPHLQAGPETVDLGTVEGIPCTSPAQTLVDLAAVVGDRTLRSCFERAAADGALDVPAIEAVLARGRRRGAPRLRPILAEWRLAFDLVPEPKLRSPFEARVLPLLAKSDLPAPRTNAVVQTPAKALEVDLLWPRQRFLVEADGRRHHGSDAAFEGDRWRDRELIRAGYRTLRVTWRQAEREAEAVIEAIRLELTARG